ncbi:MAG: hypothetical protein R6X20_01825 [Phycisphaerae bacterium]
MRQVLVLILAMLAACALTGCQKPGGQSAAEQEFKRLYEEYSDRFHEKMIGSAKSMTPAQITAEAARIWDEVFAGHQDVLDARVQEILGKLDAAEPFDEAVYVEIASGERVQPTDDQPAGTAVKQFLWNPVGTAQMALNNWLARLLQRQSFALRRLLTANAGLFWKAADRDINHPKLQMRQGPLIFTVSLTRKGDYYQVDKVRWLRPKSMGPIGITEEPEAGEEEPTPGEQGAETPSTPEKGAEGTEPSKTETEAEQPAG